jgi:integrase
MPVYKNDKNGTWYAMVRYMDWKGERKQKCQRGFATKREALDWERQFQLQKKADIDMTLESFCELYEKDVRPRLKESTWLTKESIIQSKILPYLGQRKLSEITAKDVIDWQNEMRNQTNKVGKPISPTYLKTIHGQLSSIFNHAIRYYDLNVNPAKKAGTMGMEESKEMLFWTKEEYLKFAEIMMDKPISYYAFEMLYWCGIREGELLALTPADFDFENQTVTINKSYQRLKGRDVITSPKTKKSNRVIKMPQFLVEEIQDCIHLFYSIKPHDRLFPITKHYLSHEMDRGCKAAGVKRIRIHDLRHSHVSLLIDMGFTALAIGDRVGHESEKITYRYAHLFPTRQSEMADRLNFERTGGSTPETERKGE